LHQHLELLGQRLFLDLVHHAFGGGEQAEQEQHDAHRAITAIAAW
jgi:hypothetical protein